MTKVAHSIAIGAFAAIAVPAVLIFAALWSSFWAALAAWQLYQWFAIPIGAPDLNGYHIAGLLLLVHFGIQNPKEESDKTMSKGAAVALTVLKSPLLALGSVIVGFVLAKLAGLI